jgi:hypothetical protein
VVSGLVAGAKVIGTVWLRGQGSQPLGAGVARSLAVAATYRPISDLGHLAYCRGCGDDDFLQCFIHLPGR